MMKRSCFVVCESFGMIYRFRTAIGRGVLILGTGEIKSREGSSGEKIADLLLEAVGRDEIHRRFELR